jgi:transposase
VGREVRTVGTTTKALLDLSERLASEGCIDIVMDATGVYWKPVWRIGDFTLLPANAA